MGPGPADVAGPQRGVGVHIGVGVLCLPEVPPPLAGAWLSFPVLDFTSATPSAPTQSPGSSGPAG